MIAIPAIDLRGGACVQLVGGEYDDERVRVPDPVAQARAFQAMGFAELHVVDLDAATGRGDNEAVIDALLAIPGLSLSVGGGVRTAERAARLIERGARRVVIGTKALEEPALVEGIARAHPGAVVIALDVRGREVLTRGWTQGSGERIEEVAAKLEAWPISGLLVTAVHVEGTMAGVDADLYRDLVPRTSFAIIASGGIASAADLRTLGSLGCAGAVVGMALYTGALDGAAIAKEFAA